MGHREFKSYQFLVFAFASPLAVAAVVGAVHEGDPGPAGICEPQLRRLQELGRHRHGMELLGIPWKKYPDPWGMEI